MHEYLLTLFNEISRLQQLHKSRYAYGLVAGRGMVRVTKSNLASLFEQSSRGKGGLIEAAKAYWTGSTCPAAQCHRCCFHAPQKSRRGEADVRDLNPLGQAWYAKSKGKKWSPSNKTRSFRKGIEAASKVL